MALVDFSISNPEIVLHDLSQAARRLQRERDVPESIVELLAGLCEQIGETGVDQLEGVAPHDWMALQSAALRTQAALNHDDDDQRAALRLLIEELRFRLARLAEKGPVAEDQPAADIVRWLDRALSLPQATKGDLFGVSDRTWQRWVSEEEAAEPSGDQERQARLVARLVRELQHLLSANGVFDWLTRTDPALDGRSPIEIVRAGDPELLARVLARVAAARSGAAS